jgi:hypothetical protein
MLIRRPRRPALRLGYEMNAHPAASLPELRASLARYAIPIAERLAPGEAFGIVPHIGEGLCRDLARPGALRELGEGLAARRLFPFSVNAYPLRDFHAARVKEQVYLPSWAHRQRPELTNRIADELAELLPAGERATISTLGGAYRRAAGAAPRRSGLARNYLRTVAHLERIARARGAEIALAVEAEPDTTFEVAEEIAGFLAESLLPLARQVLPGELGIAARRVEEIVLRRFAVNLDVCHAAVMFRDPVAEWRIYERAGLRVAKLHLTNALSLPAPAREPRWLHQTIGRRRDGSLWRLADLPDLARASAAELAEIEELRVHFHVPLSRARLGRLPTTRTATAAALRHALAHRAPPQLVIETYTWPWFAARAREGTASSRAGAAKKPGNRAAAPLAEAERAAADRALVAGIIGEFRWVLGEIARAR